MRKERAEIRLYDSIERQKKIFVPEKPNSVSLYVCGPTVYDRAHIGNARSVVVFDILFRFLRYRYGENAVIYARNITDIDDKINDKSRLSGKSVYEITKETTKWFHDDMKALCAIPPTHEPRATSHISDMIAMTEILLKQGHAYEAENHVLFDVGSYDDYGRLSRCSLHEMRAGARVEVAPYKKNPMDFVLWKPSDSSLPGWDSPWGRGRPGWHIECSAMVRAIFGETLDIHGGGLDLKFPHHENEIAQSICSCQNAAFVGTWMHNGHLLVDGEKMSKSLGNVITVHGAIEEASPALVRLGLLSSHYRQPLDWDRRTVYDTGKSIMDKWCNILEKSSDFNPPSRDQLPDVIDCIPDNVELALADDLNVPLAITALHKYANDGDAMALYQGASILGLDLLSFSGRGAVVISAQHKEKIESLIQKRQEARENKDFSLSDLIRDGMHHCGIDIEDGKTGSVWKNQDRVNWEDFDLFFWRVMQQQDTS